MTSVGFGCADPRPDFAISSRCFPIAFAIAQLRSVIRKGVAGA
jgi:hypothetical protein